MNTADNKTVETYAAEVQERWGGTEAYREYTAKAQTGGKDRWDGIAAALDGVFDAFAACMKTGAAPEAPEAQALVKKLQSFISENYYTCTPEILSGLGQMYVADARFKANIDRHAAGTAAFVSAAIARYSQP